MIRIQRVQKSTFMGTHTHIKHDAHSPKRHKNESRLEATHACSTTKVCLLHTLPATALRNWTRRQNKKQRNVGPCVSTYTYPGRVLSKTMPTPTSWDSPWLPVEPNDTEDGMGRFGDVNDGGAFADLGEATGFLASNGALTFPPGLFISHVFRVTRLRYMSRKQCNVSNMQGNLFFVVCT
jgi:hypothetical protein